jgi:hypothetical protein
VLDLDGLLQDAVGPLAGTWLSYPLSRDFGGEHGDHQDD